MKYRESYQYGHRLAVHNDKETYVMMIAEKIDETARIEIAPQQSDYQELHWEGTDTTNMAIRLARLGTLKKLIPEVHPVLTGHRL